MNETMVDGLVGETVVDVRVLTPRERHPRIMNTWESLAAGKAMVVVNDHDPVPLYYQFACEHGGAFHWEYLEQGPEVWRVRLQRGVFPDPGFSPGARMARPQPVVASPAGPLLLDVRPLFAAGETPCAAIESAMGQTQVGQTLVLLVPFEPVPLYAKFGRAGFRHQSRQEEDGTWRIEFRREAAGAGAVACACGEH